jgi:hypothetical protein
VEASLTLFLLPWCAQMWRSSISSAIQVTRSTWFLPFVFLFLFPSVCAARIFVLSFAFHYMPIQRSFMELDPVAV